MEVRFDLQCAMGLSQAEPVEPELFAILQAIQDRGSLQVAAKARGVSYRHAWGLMQKWQRLLGQPLAQLERGRGAKLTPLGRTLMWGQRRVAARLAPELENLGSELAAELRGSLRLAVAPSLRIHASHSLAIVLLRDLAQQRAIPLDLQFRGSLDNLRLFGQGKCVLAGFHLAEGALGSRLAPRYRRWLHPRSDALVHVVRRRQGIMTARENPKHIRSVADLAQASIKLVNRQVGSGTRLLFDLLLEDAAVSPDRVSGYNAEEFTHMAVAAMVASGAADAGFGIEAAAHHFDLGFIPVTWENYWFAVRREGLATLAVSEIVGLLRDAAYRDGAQALTGYDATQAGAVEAVDAVLG